MEPVWIGLLGMISLLVLILVFKVPIAFSLGGAGILGIIAMGYGTAQLANVVTTQPFSIGTSYVLTAIPMFVMMGYFILVARIGVDLFIAANRWVGWVRGGLAMAVTVAAAILAAVIGSATVAAATITPIAVEEMRKFNYSDKLITGISAAACNLGPLIPPSLILILYGFITETSIAHLFTAGIGSGILMALMFMLITYVSCRIKPAYGPPGPRFPLRQAIRMPGGVYIAALIIIIVLGGIYSGLTTPTEAGAWGAFIALCFGLASRRLKWREFTTAMQLSFRTTGMIMLLIFGAMIFVSMLSLSTLPHRLVEWLEPLSAWTVLILFLVILIILGFFIDIVGVILIMLPALFPALMAAGFDRVWLGILVTIVILMGHITPPFGTSVFIIGGIVKDVPMWDIFMGAFPYFIAMGLTLVLVMIFPDIAMFLVRTMYAW